MNKYILLVFILFFCFGLKAQRDISKRKINASYYQETLEYVLIDISKRTGINIAFNPSDIKPDHNVSIQIERVVLGDLLDVILEPSNLEYKVNGGQIVIIPIKTFEKEISSGVLELRGYILDGESNEALPFAFIHSENKKYHTTANSYGFFNLEIPDSINSIKVSYLGFKDKIVKVDTSGSLSIYMETNTTLDEVVIRGNKSRSLLESQDLETIIDVNEISSTQQFMGQADVIRTLYQLPGVTTAADGLGGFSVRGGNTDQNQVLLDGVPVYNSIHAMGVLSVFSPEVVKSVRFFKSHIPANYGGRVSSVTDIRTREGNLKKLQGSVGIGLMTAQASLEGPIIKDKVSFLVSARRTLLEPYLGGASSLVKEADGKSGQIDYYFSDLNAKLQFIVNPKNKLFVSFYGGRDDFSDVTFEKETSGDLSFSSLLESDWVWGNNLYNLRWTSVINEKTFSSLSLYNSNYNFRARSVNEVALDSLSVIQDYALRGSYYYTRINDIGVDWNLEYYSDNNKYTLGASIISHGFTPGLTSRIETSDSINYNLFKEDITDSEDFELNRLNEIEVFTENEFRTENLLLNYGARFTVYNVGDNNYFRLQPRIGLKTGITEKVYGKLSAGINNQYVHLLRNSGFGIPTDIWIPTNNTIKPQTAYNISAGLETNFSNVIMWNVEAYYKYFTNVLNLQEGVIIDINQNSDFFKEIPVGVGQAYGLENMIYYKTSRFDVNLNYTIGASTRTFEEINAGRRFFSALDRRHQIQSSIQYKINNNVLFNLSYTHMTGHPQTLPTQIDGEFVYIEKNNFRLPDYSRLDLSFQISNDFDWGNQQITLGLFNALNRRNVYYYYTTYELNEDNDSPFRQVSIFPILPNVSYVLKF